MLVQCTGENGGSDYILEEGGSLPLYKSVGKTEMWVIPKVSFEGFLMEHADKVCQGVQHGAERR